MNDATGEMAAAVEAAMSAATPAATPESTESTQAPATQATQTDSTTAATQTTPEAEPGPVPYARFKEVNESAKRYEEQLKGYAWIKPEHQTELQRFYQRVTGENPLEAYLDELGQLVTARPDFAGPLKSWAARTLGTRAQVQAVQEDPDDQEPQPDIPLEDGRAVYSAQQMAKLMAFHKKSWRSEVDGELQPLKETANKHKAAEIIAQIESESKIAGIKDVQAMSGEPHFNELRPKMYELMSADKNLSLERAYARAFSQVITPRFSANKAAVLQQKVGASSANPSRPSGAVSKPSTDIREETARVMAAMTGR